MPDLSRDKLKTLLQEAPEFEQAAELQPQVINIPSSIYDEGYVYNPSDPYGSLMQHRARVQPTIHQVGAFFNQAVVGEMIGGTLQSIGSLVEVPEMLSNSITESDDDFHNLVFDLGKEITDWTQEVTPIYQTGERFGDPGWWFQNGVSVASTVSMLLPGAAAVKAARGVSKALKLPTTAAGIFETATGSLVMRHAEGFREASGVFDEVYDRAIEKGLSEDEAKGIASESAAHTYNLDYLNTAFDFIQLGALTKPLRGLTRNTRLGYGLAKSLGKLPESKFARAALKMRDVALLEQVSEGVEEVVNQIAQYEGERLGEIEAGIREPDNTSISDRIKDYLKNPEVTDSFIWGTIGGMAFQQIGKRLGLAPEESEHTTRKLGEISQREAVIKKYVEVAAAINSKGVITDAKGEVVNDFSDITDEDSVILQNQLKDEMAEDLAMRAARNGNVDLLLDQIESPEFKKGLVESGIANEATVAEDIHRIKDKIETTEDLYKKHFSRLYEYPMEPYVKDKLTRESVNIDLQRVKNNASIRLLDNEYASLYAKDPTIQKYMGSPELEYSLSKKALQLAKAEVQNGIAEVKAKKRLSETDTRQLQYLEKSLDRIENSISSLGTMKGVDVTSADKRIISNREQKIILNEFNDRLTERLTELNTNEGIKKEADKVSKNVEDITRQVKENVAEVDEATRKDEVEKTKVEVDEEIKDRIEKSKEAAKEEKPKEKEKPVELEKEPEVAPEITPDNIHDRITSARTIPELEALREVVKDLKSKELIHPEDVQFYNFRIDAREESIAEATAEVLSSKRAFVKDEETSGTKLDEGLYDNTKDVEVKESIETTKENIANSNAGKIVDSEGNVITEAYSKISDGYNALAHLSRNYIKFQFGSTVLIKDISNELASDGSRAVLDPSLLKEGDEVRFEVFDVEDIIVYDEYKNVVTWGALKASLKEEDVHKHVPVRIFKGDTLIGYLHDTYWVNPSNVSGNAVVDKERLTVVREHIYNNPGFTTKVTDKTSGYLLVDSGNKYKFLGNSVGTATNYKIAVATGAGDLKVGKGRDFLEGLDLVNRKDLIPGATYLVVKTPNGSDAAIPIVKQKVGSSMYKDKITRSLNTFISAYINKDNDKLRQDILDSSSSDVYTFEGLMKLVSPFIHIYNTNGEFLRTVLPGLKGGTKFSMNRDTVEIDKLFVSPGRPEALQPVLDKLNDVIDGLYIPTNIIAYSEDSGVFMLEEDGSVSVMSYREFLKNTSITKVVGAKIGETEEGDMYTWFVQPVVRFDFSDIISAQPAEKAVSVEPEKKPSKKKAVSEKAVKKGKPKTSLNLNDEYFLPSAADEEIESKMIQAAERILSHDLKLHRQLSVVEHLSRMVTREAAREDFPDVGAITNRVFEEYKSRIDNDLVVLEKWADENPGEVSESDRAEMGLYKALSRDWDLITGQAKAKIAATNDIVDIVDFISDEDIETDENADNEKLEYAKTQYEKDIKPLLKIKRFLSDIDGGGRNIFGESNVMDYKDVFDKINIWTVDLDPSYDIIIAALKDKIEINPWVQQVVDKLEAADESVKNAFVSNLTNHYVEHIKIVWDESSARSSIVYDNRSSMNDEVRSVWLNNLKDSPLIDADPETNMHYFEDKARKKFLTLYEKLVKDPDPVKARQWLEAAGITMSDTSWKAYTGGKYWDNGYRDLAYLVKSDYNIFKVVYKAFQAYNIKDSIDNRHPLETEGAFRKLVQFEARYTDKVLSVSHRSAGKTVSSIGQNKYIVNKINLLKEDKGYVEKLLTDPFRSYSWYLKSMNTPEFRDNLSYDTVSLEAVKKRGIPGREDKELHQLNPDEYEVYKLGLNLSVVEDRSGKNKRVMYHLPYTQSDKSTAMLMRTLAADIEFDEVGKLSRKSLRFLYEQTVLPEIARIKRYESLQKAKKSLDSNDGFKNGGHRFLLFPSINNIEGVWKKDGNINPRIETLLEDRIIDEIERVFSSLVEEKLNKWNEYEIVKNGKLTLFEWNVKELGRREIKLDSVEKVASDLIYQNMIAIANTYATIIGDPALYFKTDEATTFDNLGKRMAGIVAPADEGADATDDYFTQMFAADRAVSSSAIDQYRKLFGKNSVEAIEYSDEGMLSEGTNAQEFTTVLEHFKTEHQRGLLPDGLYEFIKDKIQGKSDYNLDKILNKSKYKEFWSKYKMQVQKPRYFYHRWNEDLGIEELVYIKSSSYPLTPELTKGLAIDKLRVMMEENGIDRIAFSSGIKLGDISNPVNVWNDDGTIADITPDNISASVKTLNRRGWGIQQKVPLKLSDMISRISQADKNLFTDMDELGGFMHEGRPVKGSELKRMYNATYEKLYKYARRKLDDEVLDEDGNPDMQKLREIIETEMIKRNYDISDVEALRLDKSLRFMAFNPSSSKIEALLNSIVKNRILKLKFRGMANVLSTQEGFSVIDKSTGVIFTNSFSEEIKPVRLEKDNVKPAQIIVPFRFRDNEGKPLKLEDFIDKRTGKIDNAKLPSGILQGIAARIPNQGPNSQSWFEIVGFLPERYGDIVIAPRDYLAQMGSDFDVDKLYGYLYNTEYNEETGELSRIVNERLKDFEEKDLQNTLLDIRIAIHANPNTEVQKLILKPLDFWEFKDAANALRGLKPISDNFTSLSDQYQEDRRLRATQGKSGVGVFSNLAMFNSLIQGQNLYFYRYEDGVEIPHTLTFGAKTAQYLSPVKTIDSKTNVSHVISGLQSAAVDNENEQILDVLGMEFMVYKYVNLMALYGFSDELKYYFNQPVILDYIRKIKTLKSSLKPYNQNFMQEAYNYVVDKYDLNSVDMNRYNDKFTDGKGLSVENLETALKNNDTPDFKYIQRAALEQMEAMDTRAGQISGIMSIINTDSKGLGKSLFETMAKEESLQRLNVYNPSAYNIDGLEKILGTPETPTTIQGFATKYGLVYNNELWSSFFPYNKQGMMYMYRTIELLTGKDTDVVSHKFRKHVFEEFKSYMFTSKDLGLFEGDINEERKRILQSSSTLAHVTKQMQSTSEFRNDPFVSKLVTNVNKTSIPSTVEINAALDQTNETAMRLAFIELYTHPREINPGYTTRDYFKDLLKYAYLTGGIQKARQYIRFIPQQYLFSIPFAEKLSTLVEDEYMEDTEKMGIRLDGAYWDLPNFIIQYLQNNPDRVKKVNTSDINIISRSKGIKVGSVNVTQFTLKNTSYYITRKGKLVPPEVLNIYDERRRRSYDMPFNRNILFIYTGQRDESNRPIYTRIDNLSYRLLKQYNANLAHGAMEKSIIDEYDSHVEISKSTARSRFREVEAEDVEVSSNPEQLDKKNVVDVLGIKSGDSKVLVGVIKNIAIHSTNPFYQRLAEEIVNNPQHLQGTKVNVDYGGGRGAFNTKHNTIMLNLGDSVNGAVDGMSGTILHETLHAIVNKYIGNRTSLTGKIKASINSLEQSLNRYRGSINREKLEEVVSKVGIGEELSEEEMDQYYGAVNLEEFVAMLMTNGKFQKILNSLPADNTGKPWFEVFIEKLKKFFEALGFAVNTDSVLATSIDDVLTIIEASTEVSPVTETFNSNLPTVNVYSTDTSEFRNLSNLLNGPVRYKLENVEREYKTVEHLYQVRKALFAGDTKTATSIFNAKNGWEAQKLGRSVKGLNRNEWDKVSSSELEKFMRAAFFQSDKSRRLLLSTGDSEITHKGRYNMGKWETEFPRILMNIRKDIRQESLLPSTKTKEQVLKESNEMNQDGVQKKLVVSDSNYKTMIRRAQKVNKAQQIYKATVGTTVGESIGLNNTKEYYYIKLDARDPESMSIKERLALVTDEEVNKRIRYCRTK